MIRHLALAACLLIAGCSSLTSAELEQPAVATEVAEAPPATDYLAQGKQQGYEAAVEAQGAGESGWASVAEKWGWAIGSLNLVPADHPDYATAQAKIAEYTANQGVAYERDAAYQSKSSQTQLEVNQARAAEADPVPAVEEPVPVDPPVVAPPRSTSSSADKLPEELLAIIDGVPSSAGVYARLLDQLEPKCSENRMLIADMTVNSVQLAGDEGVRTSNLDMLNGLHTALSDGDFEMECSEVYALLIIIMGAE